MDEWELLQRFAQHGSQEAFTELVCRHLNFVYSSARRRVRSSQIAQDVTQTVFLELARQAARLKPGTPLTSWLYVVTRHAARNAVRTEQRRQAREQVAYELSTMGAVPSIWEKLEPLLDEALETLNAHDRSALFLRYFENKPLSEVGAALGGSEDAAQKRVTRAVDQLRTFFLRHGIAVTAASLATDLSAHAIQIAPAGLGATISTTALPHATTAVASQIAMSTAQKTVVGVVAALVAGAGLFEATVFARQRSELVGLDQRTAGLRADVNALRAQRDALTTQLKTTEEQIDARLPLPPISADPAMESQARVWLTKLTQLRQLVGTRSEFQLPGASLLTDEQWFSVVTSPKLNSDDETRLAFSRLRQLVDTVLVGSLSRALSAYLRQTQGVLPDRLDQLRPFTDPPLDPGLLDRFEMLRTGSVSDIPEADRVRVIGLKAPIDVEYDFFSFVGPNFLGNVSALSYDIAEAQRAFAQANAGRRATNAAELAPFLKWPVDPVVLQKTLTQPRGALPLPPMLGK